MNIKPVEINLTSDFKEIEDFPGYYVNPEGKVGKLLPSGKLRIYSSAAGEYKLKDETGKRRYARQSFLVASTFIPGFKDHYRIYFSDKDSKNCSLNNIYVKKQDLIDLPDEKWRGIPGYSNYRISNYMRVKSMKRDIKKLSVYGLTYTQHVGERILSEDNGGRVSIVPDGEESRKVSVKVLYRLAWGNKPPKGEL